MSMNDNELIAHQTREIVGLKSHKAELLQRVRKAESELKQTKQWFEELQAYIGYCGHYATTVKIIQECYTRTSNCPASPEDPNE